MTETESASDAASLEARLRDIEDRLEIYNLIASHPPSADTGADDYTRAVFTEDGVFDRGESLDYTLGNEAIAAITQRPAHQEAIKGGLAHFAGLPHVELDGDKAFVTSYLQLLHPDAEGAERELPNHGVSTGYRIHRVLANRWELVRASGGWKIKSRKLRPLDGSRPARDILSRALPRRRSAD
ncbi:MAG: nuclear transport factor 2 family protein [Nitrospinae bacterium]|nr:nuclear transport factor 2 family protein [Nitrospinota bacterium]